MGDASVLVTKALACSERAAGLVDPPPPGRSIHVSTMASAAGNAVAGSWIFRQRRGLGHAGSSGGADAAWRSPGQHQGTTR
jgi:hypothetical protein